MRILILFICLTCCRISFGQNLNQSNYLLDFQSVINYVNENHPLAKSAELINEEAKAKLMMAKSIYDPMAYYGLKSKDFENLDYYSNSEAGLIVPTIFGVDFKARYINNSGEFLNPENKVPAAGLLSFGIDVPLTDGLWNDRRRTTMKQTENLANAAPYEVQLNLAALHFEVATDYWNFVLNDAVFSLLTDMEKAANERLQFVVKSFQAGDMAAIDTTEAKIILQNRQLAKNRAMVNRQRTLMELSSHMWDEGFVPLKLDENTKTPEIPEPLPQNSATTEALEGLVEKHPILFLNRVQVQNIELENRLRKIQLMPDVYLSYQYLNSASVLGGENLDFSGNNNQIGIGVSMPLFLRRERSALKLAEIQQADLQFELYFNTQQIQNNLNATLF